jgi:hypothetical protein
VRRIIPARLCVKSALVHRVIRIPLCISEGTGTFCAMRLSKVPTFSRVRVLDLGSVDQIDGVPDTIDDVVPVWTRCERDEDPFATFEVRGVIDRGEGLVWLPDDAKVEVVERLRFAGMPEDLIKLAKPIAAPEGSKGVVKSAEGWPDLIWKSDIIYSPVQGWDDPQTSVEVILCALNVAPDDGDLRPMLLAALKARYAVIMKKPNVYPPTEFSWKNGLVPTRTSSTTFEADRLGRSFTLDGSLRPPSDEANSGIGRLPSWCMLTNPGRGVRRPPYPAWLRCRRLSAGLRVTLPTELLALPAPLPNARVRL